MTYLFDKEQLERLLPSYLNNQEKGRLLSALKQFHDQTNLKKTEWSGKLYTNFYLKQSLEYLLQGDLFMNIRQPSWNDELVEFEKIYSSALILSNTCDMDADNSRVIPKEIVLAPLIPFKEFIFDLEQIIDKKKLETTIQGIKSQIYSNVFYLPPNPDTNEDFVCLMDNVFWYPNNELIETFVDNSNNKPVFSSTDKPIPTRLASLDYFGYYLFLVKLSYHFCRLPEEKQR
jgi:hypothetical protein